jgi:hypothetical protein
MERIPSEKPQSLAEAVELVRAGASRSLCRAAGYLVGCPVGGWPETVQARRQLRDELPLRCLRSYTLDDFIKKVYVVDQSDRYRSIADD